MEDSDHTMGKKIGPLNLNLASPVGSSVQHVHTVSLLAVFVVVSQHVQSYNGLKKK